MDRAAVAFAFTTDSMQIDGEERSDWMHIQYSSYASSALRQDNETVLITSICLSKI